MILRIPWENRRIQVPSSEGDFHRITPLSDPIAMKTQGEIESAERMDL